MNSAPQLYLNPNFLTQQEIEVFMDFFEHKCPWEKPKDADFTERQHIGQDAVIIYNQEELSYILPVYEEIVCRARAEIEGFFGETVLQPKILAMRKWVVGDYQSPHSDVGHPDGGLIVSTGKTGHGPLSIHQYDIASLIYFNNSFKGGETYFEHQGISINPKPGLFAAFPASHHYLHGVSPVTEGERYVMTAFWPYVRSIVHNLIPGLPNDWFVKFSNYEDALDIIPEDARRSIPNIMLPDKYKHGD